MGPRRTLHALYVATLFTVSAKKLQTLRLNEGTVIGVISAPSILFEQYMYEQILACCSTSPWGYHLSLSIPPGCWLSQSALAAVPRNCSRMQFFLASTHTCAEADVAHDGTCEIVLEVLEGRRQQLAQPRHLRPSSRSVLPWTNSPYAIRVLQQVIQALSELYTKSVDRRKSGMIYSAHKDAHHQDTERFRSGSSPRG
jgi:hypothetical protein